MGGQLCETFGLVEYEDGRVDEVYPTQVVFADGGDFDVVAFRPYTPVKRDAELSC